MNRVFHASVAAIALAYSSFSQQAPNNSGGGTALPVVQVVQLVGDQYDGFKQSCLLVYGNARYRREQRRQESSNGRPSGAWKPPEVFEGAVSTDDLRKLNEIIESTEFRAINGNFGIASDLSLDLLHIGPWERVVPENQIDIFEASINHLNGPQSFELIGTTSVHKFKSNLKPFRVWIQSVEKHNGARLAKSVANNCSTSPLAGIAYSPAPSTHLAPKPIYTPDPIYPPNERNRRTPAAVFVQALVNLDGNVGKVSVKRGISAELDESAMQTVRKWKFEPARINDIPIPSTVTVEVSFRY